MPEYSNIEYGAGVVNPFGSSDGTWYSIIDGIWTQRQVPLNYRSSDTKVYNAFGKIFILCNDGPSGYNTLLRWEGGDTYSEEKQAVDDGSISQVNGILFYEKAGGIEYYDGAWNSTIQNNPHIYFKNKYWLLTQGSFKYSEDLSTWTSITETTTQNYIVYSPAPIVFNDKVYLMDDDGVVYSFGEEDLSDLAVTESSALPPDWGGDIGLATDGTTVVKIAFDINTGTQIAKKTTDGSTWTDLTIPSGPVFVKVYYFDGVWYFSAVDPGAGELGYRATTDLTNFDAITVLSGYVNHAVDLQTYIKVTGIATYSLEAGSSDNKEYTGGGQVSSYGSSQIYIDFIEYSASGSVATSGEANRALNDDYLYHVSGGLKTSGLATIETSGFINFISVWKTDASSVSGKTITLPTPSGGYSFTIDWGDGTVEDSVLSHTYSTPDTYTISIVSSVGGFILNFSTTTTDNHKLVDVKKWGNIPLDEGGFQFIDCINLEGFSATDTPYIGPTTSLSYCFENCSKFNSPLDHWDISNVNNISGMFRGASSFNQDLNSWNVSNVTNMAQTFSSATAFNGNISSWDTSSVTDMQEMFFLAENFNQDLSSWDVSQANIKQMFRFAHAFTSDLSSWTPIAATNFYDVFEECYNFDSDLSSWAPYTSNVTDMGFMFKDTKISCDLSSWDTSSVKNMRRMFYGCTEWSNDLSSWDISSIVDPNKDQFWDMDDMFGNSGLTSQDYSDTLVGWANENAPNEDVMFAYAIGNIPVIHLPYADSAYNYLVTTKNWTIDENLYLKCEVVGVGSLSTTATVETELSVFYSPTGQITTSGVAATEYELNEVHVEYISSGSTTTSGSAEYEYELEYVALGLISTSGEAEYVASYEHLYTADGLAQMSGIAGLEVDYVFVADGLVNISGIADSEEVNHYSYTAAGGVQTLSGANYSEYNKYAYIPSSYGSTTSGSAEYEYGLEFSGSGNINISGKGAFTTYGLNLDGYADYTLYGSEYLVDTFSSPNRTRIAKLSENKFAVIYGNNYRYVRIATISNGVITYGLEYTVGGHYEYYGRETNIDWFDITALSDSRIAVIYTSYSNGSISKYTNIRIGDISGTDITWSNNTIQTVDFNRFVGDCSIEAIDSTHIIVAHSYTYISSLYYDRGEVKTFTVNANGSVSSIDSYVYSSNPNNDVINIDYTPENPKVKMIGDDVLLTYYRAGLKARTITLDASYNITAGSVVDLTGNSDYDSIVFDSTNIAFAHNGRYITPATISGGAITLGTAGEFSPTNTSNISTEALDSQYFIIHHNGSTTIGNYDSSFTFYDANTHSSGATNTDIVQLDSESCVVTYKDAGVQSRIVELELANSGEDYTYYNPYGIVQSSGEANYYQYGIIGSGSITTSGSSVIYIDFLEYAPSGLLQTSGEATTSQTSYYSYNGIGIIQTLGGANNYSEFNKYVYSPALKKIIISGSFATQIDYSYISSGQITTSGSHASQIDYSYQGSGDISLNGLFTYYEFNQYSYNGLGIITIGSGANYSEYNKYTYTPTGRVQTSGSTIEDVFLNYSYDSVGSIDTIGTTLYEIGFGYDGSGSIQTSGEAITDGFNQYIVIGSGSILSSGFATYNFGLSYDGSGLIQTSGFSVLEIDYPYITSGGIIVSGSAECSEFNQYSYNGLGIITIGSGANYSEYNKYTYQPTGGIGLSGTSEIYVDREYEVSGSIIISGDSETEYSGLFGDYSGSGLVSVSGKSALTSLGETYTTPFTENNRYYFNDGQTSYLSPISVLDNNGIVVAFNDISESNIGKATIGTYSDYDMSFGSEYTFFNDWATSTTVVALSSTRFIISYIDNSSTIPNRRGRVLVGTRDGSLISFGSTYTFHNEWTGKAFIYKTGDDSFKIRFNDTDGSDTTNRSINGTTSGTSISLGSEYAESYSNVPTTDVTLNNHVNLSTGIDSSNNYRGYVDAEMYHASEIDERHFTYYNPNGLISISGEAETAKLSYIGSGTINTSGSAILYIDFLEYTPSGLIQTSGDAVCQTGYIISAQGGITTSGSSPFEVGYIHNPSGSITISGVANTNNDFYYIAQGGIQTLGGANNYSEFNKYVYSPSIVKIKITGEIQPTVVANHIFTPSGLIQTGGEVEIIFTLEYTSSGLITTSGSVSTELFYNYGEWVATGGLIISGSAEITKHLEYISSGTITADGLAETSLFYDYGSYIGSGRINTSGFAEYEYGVEYPSSGTIITSGTSEIDYTYGYVYVGKEGTTLSGASPFQVGYIYSADGFISTSGIAETETFIEYIASGTVTLSGIAEIEVISDYIYTATGGVEATGVAHTQNNFSYLGSGLISLSGSITPTFEIEFMTSGGIEVSGSVNTATGNNYSYTPSGRIKLSGTSASEEYNQYVYTPSGGILVTGAAETEGGKVWIGSGGLIISGTSEAIFEGNYLETFRVRGYITQTIRIKG